MAGPMAAFFAAAAARPSRICDPSAFKPGELQSSPPDIAKLKNVSSAELCCSACSAHAGCTIWLWHDATSSEKKRLVCFLRRGTPGPLKPGSGVTSGSSAAPAPPPPPFPPIQPAPKGAKNVLWFVVDDLRPQLNASYSQTHMHTPAMDKLASNALVFERAYVQFGVCAPSRTSFMTGRRPDRTQAFNFLDDFREVGIGAGWTSLPQYFKLHGFLTLGGGKTFHPNLPPNYDEPLSWSPDAPYFPLDDDKCDSGHRPVPPYATEGDAICTVENASSLFDARMADTAIGWLKLAQADNRSRPFFFAVGVRRPHLDWVVPTALYARYSWVDPGLPRQPTLPRDVHNIAWSDEAFGNVALNGTKHRNMGPFATPFEDGFTRELRRGYYAAVSWADTQMGRVLDALDASPETASRTLVVMHGDHGYQLGEKACWTKHTNFELGTRVPLIMRAPWLPAGGARITPPVEIVDMYKTMAELAGLPAPESGVQGRSLAPLFIDATVNVWGEGEPVAFSQYDRCPVESSTMAVAVPTLVEECGVACVSAHPPSDPNITRWHGACKHVDRQDLGYMGYSLRTLSWRYTAWMRWDGAAQAASWADCEAEAKGFCARELYNHENETQADFESYELSNLAADPSSAAVVARLHAQLRLQFEGDK